MLIKLREKGLEIRFVRISLKSKPCEFCFRTRSFLTLMVCIIFKMIAFVLLAVSKRMKVLKLRRKRSSHKRSWFGSVHARKVSTSFVVFEESTPDHDRYIKEVLPVALRYGNKVFGNSWIFQQDGARHYIHHLTQK